MKIEVIAIGTAAVLGCIISTTARSQVQVNGAVTTVTVPTRPSGVLNQSAPAGTGIDFENAVPMPLPAANSAPPLGLSAGAAAPQLGQSGIESGNTGNGVRHPVQLVAPRDLSAAAGIEPEDYGTGGLGAPQQPYTTARANANGDLTVDYYPFRAAGKLFFLEGSTSYVCSASLIKPGIVVTAGHCAANYGQSHFWSGWTFVPAYNNGSAPYGSWTAKSATVLSAYYNGTDNCFQYGVICPDDIALLTLNPQNGNYPGASTGWLGYGYGGYDYNSSGQALITQLGYPVDLDGGLLMQRNDSQGFVYAAYSNNTIIGSLMTGGSSGGPWTVNLGMPPTLSGGDTFGTSAGYSVAVGVTGWGYTSLSVKQMGASPFTSGNIVPLLSTVCGATPGAC
jgi:V8-like Glu-specific endopeptidase